MTKAVTRVKHLFKALKDEEFSDADASEIIDAFLNYPLGNKEARAQMFLDTLRSMVKNKAQYHSREDSKRRRKDDIEEASRQTVRRL